MRTLWADFRYMLFTVFHPFKAFYELRFHRKRNRLLIGLLFFAYGIVQIFKTYYSGMLVNSDVYGENNLTLFLYSIFPFLLFAVSNWSVTVLFDGNGKIEDILMVLAYASFPKLFTDILYTILSNFITNEELVILNVINMLGVFMLCMLTFFGLCVIHEYMAAKNLLMIGATAIAALIVIFIGMLYFEVIEKLIGFFGTVLKELLDSQSI